jgi:hypothetical protein
MAKDVDMRDAAAVEEERRQYYLYGVTEEELDEKCVATNETIPKSNNCKDIPTALITVQYHCHFMTCS